VLVLLTLSCTVALLFRALTFEITVKSLYQVIMLRYFFHLKSYREITKYCMLHLQFVNTDKNTSTRISVINFLYT
jgi:hypothetical protein